MAESLTTLQLARRIADGVIAEYEADGRFRDPNDRLDSLTQAVMRTLDDTGSWFCRVSEDETGATVLTRYEGQGELFT